MFEPIWRKDDFVIRRGEPSSHALVSEGSSKEVVVHFCGTCGTNLYLSFERFPDVVGFYGGTLDHPASAVAGLKPECIFLDEAIEGTVIPAGANSWRRHRLTPDGMRIAPVHLTEALVI